MNLAEFKMQNPLILALDVDSYDQAIKLSDLLAGKLGAIKVGPRLLIRYGGGLVAELAKRAPVFVDNKYLDIPNTMEAAVRATFAAGATFATVHAWAGRPALERLAKVEQELSRERPFKILVVTILTSFTEQELPPGMSKSPILEHVSQLADLTLSCGLTGIVCSPKEVAGLRAKSRSSFLVTPGIRLHGDSAGDQKRIETPEAALRGGASAVVVGRPIYEAHDPVKATEQILKSVEASKK